MSRPEPGIYEFDAFSLDAGKRLLRRRGEPVALTPRVFDTLLYLVRHQGRVLEKEELMRAIWPDSFVEENNLTQNISTLRQALGESRGENRYIVTVPGRGYRFAADVRTSAGHYVTPPAPPDKTIAVLAFDNMSADPENEYFCDGLAEEILNAISKIEGLRVAARTSAFSFKGKKMNVGEIGRALGVSTILEGSVRRSGHRMRITAQLIDASNGYHLWSESYDREIEMRDIFDVQDEITLAVVEALKGNLLGTKKTAALKRQTENTEAYHLYLKGRYYWFKSTPEEFRKSREFFQRAVEADPSYALGHAGLAYFYGFASSWGMMPPLEGWPKMEAAILKAGELDGDLAEVHNGLAALKWIYRRDWDGAERELKRALELNPNFAEAHNVYGIYLAAKGQFDEAIGECRKALALDPLSVRFIRFLGNWFYFARRYDDAIRQYSQALELDLNNAAVYEDLGDAHEQKGMHAEAVAAWRTGLILAGDNELAGVVDSVYNEEGFPGVVRKLARARLERLNAKGKRGEYVPAIQYARAHLRLGREGDARRWLEKAGEERNAYSLLINRDPFYDSLRTDSRHYKA